MANDPTSVWTPEWSVAPGDVLLEVLEDRGLSQSELARRLDRPIKTVNEIVKGKAAITADTAIQLERTLGISARFWTNLEANYRETIARQRAQTELKKEASWARRFPLKELTRYRFVPAGATPSESVDAVLRFFGVSSRTAWEKRWQPTASFRASPAFKSIPESVATWLRWGEILAATVETQPYSAAALRQALPTIRKLTTVAPAAHAVDELRKIAAACGVALALIPELPGAPVSGAARWLASDKALIQLSLRHKRDDQFWFTVFHEFDHILHPQRRIDFIDAIDSADDGDEDEAHANQSARDILIPPDLYEQFLARDDVTAASIKQFARDIGIAPGIVVGRLQRDAQLARPKLDTLKRSMHWMEPPKPRPAQ